MCIYIYVCMYVCLFVCMHACMHIFIFAINMYIHITMYIWMYVYNCIYVSHIFCDHQTWLRSWFQRPSVSFSRSKALGSSSHFLKNILKQATGRNSLIMVDLYGYIYIDLFDQYLIMIFHCYWCSWIFETTQCWALASRHRASPQHLSLSGPASSWAPMAHLCS